METRNEMRTKDPSANRPKTPRSISTESDIQYASKKPNAGGSCDQSRKCDTKSKLLVPQIGSNYREFIYGVILLLTSPDVSYQRTK